MIEDHRSRPADRTLREAILDEQRSAWDSGERTPVEQFLARHAALVEDSEAILDLIYQEFLIRRSIGESPDPAEYLRRFPAWSEPLIRQFAVDELMRSVAPATVCREGDEAATLELRDSAAAGRVPPTSTAPRSIDGYDILDELGRGGMGIVYKARERQLNRVVAIKTISESAFASPAQRQRFLVEAEVIARLRHPHIIAIHAYGEQEGRPYFSLEFAERGSLAQRLAEAPMNARQATELVATLAHAVQAAHERGIIHRDLKPSNVLLAGDGTPKIADFGLAKLLDDDSARTATGEVLGTPSYMAPEQADGHSREVGPAADIYALGAILYQTLTGRPPFLGASAMETLRLVVSAEVVPPRRQRPDVPRDLETIALKCLEKEPRRRYSDAASLADDLRRYLEGRPIAARPVSPVGRLTRWGGRNPALATSAAALLLTLVVGTPALIVLWLQARADRSRAEVQRDLAERYRDRAKRAVGLLIRTEHEDILVEEMLPLRKALLEAGARESLALVSDLGDDPRAELQRLDTYDVLARIQSDGGDPSGARETIRKAITLAERLAARAPANHETRRALARTLHRAATVYQYEAEGPVFARRSNDILRSLLEDANDAESGELIVLSAMNHFNAGNMHAQKGRSSEAFAEFQAARADYDTAMARGDRSPGALDLAAKNLLYLCRILGSSRLEESLEAGRRAESIFQTLVREQPDHYEHSWQLSLAQEELGIHLSGARRWPEAIHSFEAVRRTLKDMAARHGNLVSRMARIQERIATVDLNLIGAYESDPARYAAASRELTAEAYEICDKLGLVQPLSWNLRIVHATTCFAMADYQTEDGLSLDIELLLKANRLWEAFLRENATSTFARASLVVVRRRLAEELADRGRADEAAAWARRSLETAR
ncbi:MAG: serine/threonine-protein kinase, partial [Isosphaeraceae bacterium]